MSARAGATPPPPRNPLHHEAQILANALDGIYRAVEAQLRPGLSTQEIDDIVARELAHRNLQSSYLGYLQYPARSTTSINEEVINTLPSDRKLQDGDLLKLQIGVRGKETFATQGWTYMIGAPKPADRRLHEVALEALRLAISEARVGSTTGDLGAAIQGHLEQAGYTSNRHFVGHAVGRAQHEDPPLPGYGKRGKGARLQAGMMLSINVIAHAGSSATEVLDDGWNAVAVDGMNAVLFSQMVIVGDGEPEILTAPRPTVP